MALDRAKLDRFYKDPIGFHLYWEGGSGPGRTDWVIVQVRDSSDWLEHMLYFPSNALREELAGAHQLVPGVENVTELDKRPQQRSWRPSPQEKPRLLGVDGKWQLDLHDLDGTGVEFMEFRPVQAHSCSKYTGKQQGRYLTQ